MSNTKKEYRHSNKERMASWKVAIFCLMFLLCLFIPAAWFMVLAVPAFDYMWDRWLRDYFANYLNYETNTSIEKANKAAKEKSEASQKEHQDALGV